MSLVNALPTAEAIANNSWYSPDLKFAAFLGADGRLCVIVDGYCLQYLYPNMPDGRGAIQPA